MIEIDNIYNIDCLEGLKQIADKSIDLVVTDPPYEFVSGGMKNPKWNIGKMKADSYMITKMASFKEPDVRALLDALVPKFKHGYNAYFFCSEMQIVYYLKWAQEHKLRYNMLIWDRLVDSIISKKFYRSHIDYIVRIYGDGNSLRDNGDIPPMRFYSKIKQGSQGKTTKHETEKNVSVISELILASSDKGDLILDPFMGSATTAIACRKTDRHYIGFEINEEYYKMACKRIENDKMQLSLF